MQGTTRLPNFANRFSSITLTQEVLWSLDSVCLSVRKITIKKLLHGTNSLNPIKHKYYKWPVYQSRTQSPNGPNWNWIEYPELIFFFAGVGGQSYLVINVYSHWPLPHSVFCTFSVPLPGHGILAVVAARSGQTAPPGLHPDGHDLRRLALDRGNP